MITEWFLAISVVVTTTIYANPLPDNWRSIQLEESTVASSTKWAGIARIRGGLLISRINFQYLNKICNDLETDIVTSTQTITTVTNLNFKDKLTFVLQRLSFMILTLEKAYANLLFYTESYLLCTYDIATKTRTKYLQFQRELDKVWTKLKKQPQLNKRHEPRMENNTTTILLNSTIITAITNSTRHNKHSTFKFLNMPNTELRTSFPVVSTIDILAAARPEPTKEAFFPILIGLGAAFGGGLLTGTLLNNNINNEQIQTLNNNIHKVNENVRITNNRIDVLTKNISTTISDIKTVLSTLTNQIEISHKLNALLWNLDKLAENAMHLLILFKLQKSTITLLEAGIINPDLLDISAVKNIISEGITKFNNLEFPVPVNRDNMKDIFKLATVEKISQNNFVMLIPLFRKEKFHIYTLTPHPLRIKNSELVIPTLTQLILVNNNSYITAETDHLRTINNETHVLTIGMPIWQHTKPSCEWETFRQNLDGMLTACTFTHLGEGDKTFFSPRKHNNLLYLTTPTKVNFKCPGTNIRDTLQGLYTIPRECEVITDTLQWSPIQSVKIDLNELLTNSTTNTFDSTKLPIIDFNKTDSVHQSLKDIIEKIPNSDTPFTFNFTNDYTLQDVKNYSVIAYGTLSILVIIQYVFLGSFLIIYCTRLYRKRNKLHSTIDSLSKFRRNLQERDSIRNLRDNLRHKKDKLKTKLNETIPHPSSPALMLNSLRSSIRNKTDVGVDTTDLASTKTNTRKVMYPAIPRY